MYSLATFAAFVVLALSLSHLNMKKHVELLFRIMQVIAVTQLLTGGSI